MFHNFSVSDDTQSEGPAGIGGGALGQILDPPPPGSQTPSINHCDLVSSKRDQVFLRSGSAPDCGTGFTADASRVASL